MIEILDFIEIFLWCDFKFNGLETFRRQNIDNPTQSSSFDNKFLLKFSMKRLKA